MALTPTWRLRWGSWSPTSGDPDLGVTGFWGGAAAGRFVPAITVLSRAEVQTGRDVVILRWPQQPGRVTRRWPWLSDMCSQLKPLRSQLGSVLLSDGKAQKAVFVVGRAQVKVLPTQMDNQNVGRGIPHTLASAPWEVFS